MKSVKVDGCRIFYGNNFKYGREVVKMNKKRIAESNKEGNDPIVAIFLDDSKEGELK